MANRPTDEGSISQEPDSKVRYWLAQIETAQKARRVWYERSREINKRYLDESAAAGMMSADAHSMNVLWSNIETMKPALYAKTPNPQVTRRYRDKDKIGRWGATVLERSLGFELECYDFDYVMRACVSDYLLVGGSQVWVSYDPQIEGNAISWEKVRNKHLHYRDFLHGPGRTWDEVTWVAQRAYLTKEEAAAHPHIKANADKLTFAEADELEERDSVHGEDKKAEVWEIWDKTGKRVIYVSKNCPELLGEVPPYLDLEGFFPCPRPILGTKTTDSLVPVPDFYLYQNQADEIDMLTARIHLLTQALRVVGLYDGALESLQRLLDGNRVTKNEMVACDNWAVFAQNGGFKGAVAFFPLDEIIKALKECYEARERAKQVMYEVTGISDIVRGASDPNETARAQEIKTQWGGLRIRDRQAEVQRFARDVMRLNAEIMAEYFQPETLKTMSNVPLLDMAAKQQLQQRQQMIQQAQMMAQQNPEQAQAIAQANPQIMQMLQPLTTDELQALQEPAWEEVIQLLKDQKLRAYRIDIETDSTINTDEQAEKEARTEFITALTTVVQTWGPMVMAQPQIAPLFGEVLLFAVRAFPTADALETVIEETVETLSQQQLLGPPPPPPEDPKIAEGRAKSELEAKKHDDTMGLERERMDREDAFRREDAEASRQAQIQSEQLAAQKEIEIARAQQPKTEDIAAVIKPIEEALSALVEQNKEFQAVLAYLANEIAAVSNPSNPGAGAAS